MPLPRRLLVPISIKISSFSKHHVHNFGNGRYERTDGRTDGQPENIMPLPKVAKSLTLVHMTTVTDQGILG